MVVRCQPISKGLPTNALARRTSTRCDLSHIRGDRSSRLRGASKGLMTGPVTLGGVMYPAIIAMFHSVHPWSELIVELIGSLA